MGETDPSAIEKKRKLVGTMIEGPYIYPGYTVRQNVELQRLLVGNPDESATDRIIEKVGLGDSKKKKAKKLSMGMKQRLGIAMALIGNPKLLILDEPINGLDPTVIRTSGLGLSVYLIMAPSFCFDPNFNTLSLIESTSAIVKSSFLVL